MFQDIGLMILSIIILIMISVPPILFLVWYIFDKRQSQHSVLRNFPILGRVRYFLEMLGPELRQYMFDSDDEGKPFSRSDFSNIVVQGKYLKTVIAFGSKLILTIFDPLGGLQNLAKISKINDSIHKDFSFMTANQILVKRFLCILLNSV